jgi:hypothetical protein
MKTIQFNALDRFDMVPIAKMIKELNGEPFKICWYEEERVIRLDEFEHAFVVRTEDNDVIMSIPRGPDYLVNRPVFDLFKTDDTLLLGWLYAVSSLPCIFLKGFDKTKERG